MSTRAANGIANKIGHEKIDAVQTPIAEEKYYFYSACNPLLRRQMAKAGRLRAAPTYHFIAT
jgi:hypothetical protein